MTPEQINAAAIRGAKHDVLQARVTNLQALVSTVYWILRDHQHAPTPKVMRELIAAIEQHDAKPTSYVCKLCGQRIDDGKPCGCGAR